MARTNCLLVRGFVSWSIRETLALDTLESHCRTFPIVHAECAGPIDLSPSLATVLSSDRKMGIQGRPVLTRMVRCRPGTLANTIFEWPLAHQPVIPEFFGKQAHNPALAAAGPAS